MPIGNQEIWDKGIGAGATNVIFGGGDTQPSATNFNPGALGADPNAQPASPATPETPATPATPTTPAQPAGPVEKPKHQNIVNAEKDVAKYQLLYQQAMQSASGKAPGGISKQQALYYMQQAQQKLLHYQQQYG